ncbi:hypothetical protein TruAng_000826 [Truncatella angustata]|nr:hypothetical protein TruAng_000826 [Truncatella angustata]
MLVTLILAIRVYTRLRIVRNFGLDDILIIVAFAPSFGFTVCGIYAEFNLGWERHLWDVPYGVLESSSRLSLVTLCLFDLSSNLVKLSTLAMLYRLVRVTKSRMKTITLLIMAFVVVSGLLFIFITIFQCNPIWEYWTLSAKPQNCINEANHLLAAGTINTVTDFAVVLLPIKTVAVLHLPRKQYIILIGLFCAGFCACIAGCVRTYYTWIFTVDYDKSWHGWTVWVSSAIELYLGIVCASVPSCKQFFTTYLPGVIDSTRRSGGNSGGGSSSSSNPNRKSSRISSTVNTLVEASRYYCLQNRSNTHTNLLMDQQGPTSPGGYELSDFGARAKDIAEPQRAKVRPLTWPSVRPASSIIEEELGLERVSTKRSSEHGGSSPRLKGTY